MINDFKRTGNFENKISVRLQLLMKDFQLAIILVCFVLLPWDSSQTVINSTQLAIVRAQSQNQAISKTIDSIFLRLPTIQDLQQIIGSGDTLALTRLLQVIQIKREDIPCNALAVYSDEVIGMIRVALEKSLLTLSKLQVVNDLAQREIQRLESEIQRLVSEKDLLGLSSLMEELDRKIDVLQDGYDQYNSLQKELPPIEARIQGNLEDIKILEAQADGQRSTVIAKRLILASQEDQIRRLESLLKSVQERKRGTVSDITSSETLISQNEKAIKLSRQRIKQLESEADEINTRSDLLKKKNVQLEIQTQRIRTDIYLSRALENQIILEIDRLTNRVDLQKQKLSTREEEYYQKLTQTLEQALIKFENRNTEIYYNCFGQGSIDVEKVGSVLIYIVRGERIANYLQHVYDKGLRPINFTSQDMRFQVINPFDSVWRRTYGTVFSSERFTSGSSKIQDDFTCLSPSKVISGNSIIKAIKGNIIQIQGNNNNTINLYIGACSRIETTALLPKPQQRIFFNALFTDPNANLYTATCFD